MTRPPFAQSHSESSTVRRRATFLVALIMAGAATSPASAHTFGAWGAGFPQGFLHPTIGLDHILAMTGVGFWAGQSGGRARWLVPLAFVAAMVLGGALGLSGVAMPATEVGIAGSVVLIGLLIALRAHLPLGVGMTGVAVFAIFHGFAHGAEAPEAAQPVLYTLGFILATALLHAIGIGLAWGAERLLPRGADRLVGSLTGVLGVGLLLGW